jgi:hypothetical protein
VADYDFSVAPLVREDTAITYETDFRSEFSTAPIGQAPVEEHVRSVPMLPRREP